MGRLFFLALDVIYFGRAEAVPVEKRYLICQHRNFPT
jgi:hypothetical protein